MYKIMFQFWCNFADVSIKFKAWFWYISIKKTNDYCILNYGLYWTYAENMQNY